MTTVSTSACRAEVWVVIPAYNEATVLGEVVATVRKKSYRVVVVDDGSADATGDEAHKAGAHVVTHPINMGQGASLQTGIRYACMQGAAYVVTFDADGQHCADEIQLMLDALQASNADIALGSRFTGRAVGIPKLRKLTLKAAILFTHITSGVRLSDAHNGFRAMTRECAKRLRIHQNGMAHASEIIEFIGHHKLRYVEIPVTITYSDYSLRKGQKISNSIRILIDLFLGKIAR